jgi:hypothetical protein
VAFSGPFPGVFESGAAIANPVVNTNSAVTTAVTRFAERDRSRFRGRSASVGDSASEAVRGDDPGGVV